MAGLVLDVFVLEARDIAGFSGGVLRLSVAQKNEKLTTETYGGVSKAKNFRILVDIEGQSSIGIDTIGIAVACETEFGFRSAPKKDHQETNQEPDSHGNMPWG